MCLQTLEEAQWACSLALSRETGGSTGGFIYPVLDLANHHWNHKQVQSNLIYGSHVNKLLVLTVTPIACCPLPSRPSRRMTVRPANLRQTQPDVTSSYLTERCASQRRRSRRSVVALLRSAL